VACSAAAEVNNSCRCGKKRSPPGGLAGLRPHRVHAARFPAGFVSHGVSEDDATNSRSPPSRRSGTALRSPYEEITRACSALRYDSSSTMTNSCL
jgi:hypothetical protein